MKTLSQRYYAAIATELHSGKGKDFTFENSHSPCIAAINPVSQYNSSDETSNIIGFVSPLENLFSII